MSEFLNSEIASHPDQTVLLQEIGRLHSSKLWHQLTTAITKLSLTPAYTMKPAFLHFHSSFIHSFRTAIAPLAYAELTARAAEQADSPQNATALLTKAASDVSADSEASLLIDLEQTRYEIRRYRSEKSAAMTDEINDADDAALEACRDRIEAAKKRLDSYAGVMDAKLFSLFYRTSAEFDSAAGLDSEFFTDAMLFMTYQNVDALTLEDRQSWAKQLALSAIKGKNVYNYGELIQHRIIDTLRGGPNGWTIALITALNAGDMAEFNAEWSKLPNNADTTALRAIEPFLREKLTILALIELLFQRAPSNRVVAFTDIASAVKAPVDRVEFILMKALALGVIRGVIDQVDQTIRVTWVQPRILNMKQVAALKDRFTEWITQVDRAIKLVQDDAHPILKQQA